MLPLKSVRNRLIHLIHCRSMTRNRLRRVMKHDPTLESLFSLSATEIHHLYKFPLSAAKSIYEDLRNPSIRQQICDEISNFKIITIVDESYPPVLNTIKDAPLVLYAAGDTSLLELSPAISVIGTRKPSPEAIPKMRLIVKPLVKEGWVIVSGMARGIDSLSHRMALQNNGKTIAVLGGGFHHIYPKENLSLFRQLIEKGLVLSEYPPDRRPEKYHFPERNRIISGLGFGTLVIEAMERSGTLITVDQALDQGREVYAVPGSPAIRQTIGCHKLIQDGAKLVHHHKDILEDWLPINNYK